MAYKVSLDDAQARLDIAFQDSGLKLKKFSGTSKSGTLLYGDEELPFSRYDNLFQRKDVNSLVESLRNYKLGLEARAVQPMMSISPPEADPISEQIGDRLTAERVRLAYSRQDLATKLGVDLTTLKGYELGAYDLPAPLLAKLAQHGFDIQFIVTNARSLAPDGSGQVLHGNNNIQVGHGSHVSAIENN